MDVATHLRLNSARETPIDLHHRDGAQLRAHELEKFHGNTQLQQVPWSKVLRNKEVGRKELVEDFQ